ncbi:hypothetical protein [Anaerococcus provencensis]|uniref:hypothetical protein n=1 Tax=Anaerococcus provencensis TaxID=938293 RepID=UPI0002E757BA|nr:hypothetical protein [Anaerococcus provencensis]
MGKLLGRIFKEDIKNNILWLTLPLIFTLILTRLLNTFGENPLVIVGIAITMVLVVAGPFIALISVAVNDYERFYGKYAAFYSAIPAETGSINAARFINYLLMFLLAGLFAFANFSILVNFSYESNMNMSDIFQEIAKAVSSIGGKNFAVLILYMIILTITNIMQVIFSITAGSSGIFGRPSKGKVILIFIIISLIVGLIFAKIQVLSASNYEESVYVTVGGTNIEMLADNSNGYRAIIAPMVYNVLISLSLAGGAFYLHDRKLSVA